MVIPDSIMIYNKLEGEKKLIGFHGTKKKAYDSIKIEGFRVKARDTHWLGQGVYFFLEDFEEAKRWAVYCIDADPKEVLGVIEARIEVPYNQYLNLDTASGHDLLVKYAKDVITQIEEKQIGVEGELSKEKIRCLILDSISRESVKVITMSFQKKPSKSVNEPHVIGNAFDKRHIQICVRDTNCIKSQEFIEVKDGSKKRKTNRRSIG